MSELRSSIRLRLSRRDVHYVSIDLLPGAIIKILAEQAELPKLIRDVLAHIGDRIVGSHDDLAVLRIFVGLVLERTGGHHPATLVFPFGLEVDGLALLEVLESSL